MDQRTLADTVQHLLTIFADAETRMQVLAAQRLALGIESSTWAEQKLSQVTELRLSLQRLLSENSVRVQALLAEVLSAYTGGAREQALADLEALGLPVPAVLANPSVPLRLAHELTLSLNAAASSASVAVAASYRSIINETTALAATRTTTRRELLGEAVSRFADAGVAGFTDKAGRVWQLQTYADMAVRTTLHNAVVDTRVQTFQAAGQSYVIVSDSPHECPRCRPYELQVLSLGADQPPNDIGGFSYGGTLGSAQANGLLHPGCRHNLGAFVPSLSVPPSQPTADPAGEQARQQQRYYERQVRDAKRRVAVLEPLGDTTSLGRAKALLDARSARLADHLDSPEAQAAGLNRRYDRERVWLPSEGAQPVPMPR